MTSISKSLSRVTSASCFDQTAEFYSNDLVGQWSNHTMAVSVSGDQRMSFRAIASYNSNTQTCTYTLNLARPGGSPSATNNQGALVHSVYRACTKTGSIFECTRRCGDGRGRMDSCPRQNF